MGLCADPPPPPDYSALIDAAKINADTYREIANAQLDWAKEQFAQNKEVLNKYLDYALPMMKLQYDAANKDRQRYETLFQPMEDKFVQDVKEFDTPERRDQYAGEAVADVKMASEAERRAAQQRLESYGIDPSQVRSGALDINMRVQQAANEAGAANTTRRQVENQGRQLTASAVNMGKGYPAQVTDQVGSVNSTGANAVGQSNSTFATGANVMGTPGQWAGMSGNALGQAANFMSQSYQDQMSNYNASGSIWDLAGAAAGAYAGGYLGGMGMKQATNADGGQVRRGYADGGDVDDAAGQVVGPGDGSGIDDAIPIRVSDGEYVIPADVVEKKGTEFFDKLVEKYHTPAAVQREQNAQEQLPELPASTGIPYGRV